MSRCSLIVLTGGPGGGKTTLLEELGHDHAWRGELVALPEAISLMPSIGISPHKKLFQRVMVHLQMALEDGVIRGLASDEQRIIVCHRGSLDPLAYWLDWGWSEDEFFAFTETRREQHYQRYAAIIHLVTAADGAVAYYKRYPEANRPETPHQAIQIDRLLERVWGKHPHYYRIGNKNLDWPAKEGLARDIVAQVSNPQR